MSLDSGGLMYLAGPGHKPPPINKLKYTAGLKFILDVSTTPAWW